MRRLLITIILLCTIALVMGLVCKKSYTDKGLCAISTIEDVRELDCNVNQIFTEDTVGMFISDIAESMDVLGKQCDIYVVEPLNYLQQNNFTMIQSVRVSEVIRGDAVVGEEINIVTSGGVYDSKYQYHEYDNDRPIFYGLMNLLYPQNDYLVFLAPLGTNQYAEEKSYYYTFPILSAFNLSSDESVVNGENIENIHYNDFGSSEFLCDSQYTLECLLEYKREVLKKYGLL